MCASDSRKLFLSNNALDFHYDGKMVCLFVISTLSDIGEQRHFHTPVYTNTFF